MQGAWYKNKVVLGVIVVVLVVLGVTLFGGDKEEVENVNTGGNNEQSEEVSVKPRSGEVLVTGKFGCTPLKSGATPTAAQCVLGLMGDDGKFYALDTSNIESAASNIDGNSSLKIVGVYTAINTSSEEAGVFKYDGVIAVRVMAENK